MTKSLWDTTCGNVGRMGAWEHLRCKLSAGPCREMELEQAGGKEARTGTEQVVLDVHDNRAEGSLRLLGKRGPALGSLV